MAMQATIPVHVGIDNKTVVDNLNALLRFAKGATDVDRTIRPTHLSPWGKPCLLINDGDLWRIAWTILCQRGQASIMVSKVKGHATEEDVEQVKVQLEDKIGNDAGGFCEKVQPGIRPTNPMPVSPHSPSRTQ